MTLREPTTDQARRLNRWRISTFWVILIGYISYYLGRGNLPVALPLLSSAYGYSNEQLAVLLTFSELAYAAGKFINGPIADKVGGKRIFLIGLSGAIVFNIVFSFFSSIFMFTVVWCLCRFFLSMGWAGVIKTIGEWYEPERNGTMMGIISINFQFGGVAASLFCAGLLYLGSTWQGLFIYPAGVMTLVAIWAALASRESPQSVYPGVKFGRNAGSKQALLHGVENHSSWQRIRDLFRIPMFRQILVFAFLTTILRTFFTFWTPKFLVDIGMGTVAVAMTSAVFPFLGCLGTVLLGWYTDNYAKDGDRASMMWKMLVGLVISLLVVAFLVPYKLEHQFLLVAFLAAAGFFLYGPYSMSAGALSLDIAGAEGAGTCAGFVDGVGYIGGALATWGTGVLSTRMGWTQVFYVLAGCAVLSVISAYVMSRAYRRS